MIGPWVETQGTVNVPKQDPVLSTRKTHRPNPLCKCSLFSPPVMLLFISRGYNESRFNKRLLVYPWVHSEPKCTRRNDARRFFENTTVHVWNFVFGSSFLCWQRYDEDMRSFFIPLAKKQNIMINRTWLDKVCWFWLCRFCCCCRAEAVAN